MNIIVSDIEGTLTTGSSWRGLRSYFKDNYRSLDYDLFFLKWLPIFPVVKIGLMSRREVMSRWLQDEIRLLKGASSEEINEMASWIVEHVMWPKRRMEVIDEIDHHRRKGAQIALVSSAYQPIVAEFAKCIDAIPIGSPLIFHERKLVGVELPINSFEHKSKTIRDHFGGKQISLALGDTASDIPMMEMGIEPVAVFPDKYLRKYAESRGWRILDDHR